MAHGVAQGSGTTARVSYSRYYPATINDPDAVKFVRSVASTPPLNLRLADVAPSLAAEDFSFMLREVRGCYIWLGAGKSGENPGIHSPRYDFNDEALPIGVALWASLVRRSLHSA